MAPAHAQIRALVEQALDLDSPAEREQLLAACGDPALAGEVRALLGLETKVVALDHGAARLAALAGQSQWPAQFGPYRVLGVLGRGGMGDVYLGVRDDGSFRKEVAIKVARDVYSTEQQHRFLRERELLARLEHPAIAHVLDGGSTASGQAWMAIERVDGVPLDQFARERGLSVRERVALLLRVLDGVQYAHQNLIVHRDLKPSNVLVQADGQPKLLDFGIAKLLGSSEHTQTNGRAPMTLAYAAPEQIRGEDVTTATDVYALGVILYELLTGERPHKVKGNNPLALLQVITDTDPTAPSESLRRRGGDTTTSSPGDVRELKGDLDTIVLKALNRDPLRRYPSAQAMRDDLERFLGHQPIKARPDSLGYRARKWLRRNRAVAAVAALATIGLLAAAILVIQERNRAISNAQVAEATKRFVLKAFTGADRWRTSQDMSARELALQGLAAIETELKDQPEARIEMYDTLGQVFGSSGPLTAAMQAREAQLREMKQLGGYSTEALIEVELRLLLTYRMHEEMLKSDEHARRIEAEYADRLNAYDRMFMLQLQAQAAATLGDFLALSRLMPDLLDPAKLHAAAAAASSQQRRKDARTFESWARAFSLVAPVVQRRDREAATQALATLQTITRDIDPDDLQRANLAAHPLDALMRVSRDPALLAMADRSARWSDEQYGGPGAALEAKRFMAEQDGDLELAGRYHAQLEAIVQSSGSEAIPTFCREHFLAGGGLALSQGQHSLARQHYEKSLQCARAIDGPDWQSPQARAAQAGLVHLDVLEGKAEVGALQRLAQAQREHDDGTWWLSAFWLAELCLQGGDNASCLAQVQAIEDWHVERSARRDARILALYARVGLPIPAQPDYSMAEAVRLGSILVADGERIVAQRRASKGS